MEVKLFKEWRRKCSIFYTRTYLRIFYRGQLYRRAISRTLKSIFKQW